MGREFGIQTQTTL